jgi:penicillin-binding protein 1A
MGFTGQYVVGVWLGNDDFSPMARVTGGSFPAQTWHNFLMLAHDTDNIPQIPGVDLHPLQVAEQERIALAQQLNPNAEILAPTPESVRDMPPATREALDKLAALLRKVVPLNPNDRQRDKQTQAPSSGPAAQSQSSVASAARSQSEAANADPPQLQAPQSADSDGGASPPP